MQMKKNILIILSLCLTFIGQSQDKTTGSFSKFIIQGSYSHFPVYEAGNTTPNLRIESEYNFNKFVGAGIYLGAGKSAHDHKIDISPVSYYYYGIQSTLHLLPFIQKMDKSRFDLFVPVKAGRCHQQFSSYKYSWWNFSGGLGLAYYLSKHFGVYTEGNLILGSKWKINTYAKSPVELRVGISMKIK